MESNLEQPRHLHIILNLPINFESVFVVMFDNGLNVYVVFNLFAVGMSRS